jgi:hypothetical protein
MNRVEHIYIGDASRRCYWNSRQTGERGEISIPVQLQSRAESGFSADNLPFGDFCAKGWYCQRCSYNSNCKGRIKQ